MQMVQISSAEDLEDVIVDSRRAKTMLTQFFKKNFEVGNGKKFLYIRISRTFYMAWKEKRIGQAF